MVYLVGVLSIAGFMILGLGEGFLFYLIYKIAKNSNGIKKLPRRIKYLSVSDVNQHLEDNFAYSEPSCFDIESAEAVTIPPGGRVLIETGLIFDLPKELEIQIRPRSGYTYTSGNMAVFGTIDSDYRGTFKVNCFNFSDETLNIAKGDRIGQGYINEKTFIAGRDHLINVKDIEKFDRPSTKRGNKGFGSSGMKKNKTNS